MEDKVLLLQDIKKASFGSERIRKNIKAALIDAGISYTDNIEDPNYELAHVIYPIDPELIERLINGKKKVVVSICYSENDKASAASNLATLMDNDGIDFDTNEINLLQKTSKILVPCKEYLNALINEGIDKDKIEVVTPGINTRIYRYVTENDMALAKRHFSIDENTKIILCIGSFYDKQCIERVKRVAKLRPDCNFIYLCQDKPKPSLIEGFKERKTKKLYKNLIFSKFYDINIYRSLLKNIRIALFFNSYMADEVQILEAFAAEAQVIAIDSAVPEALRNSIIVHSDDANDVYKMISNFLDYKISNTISKEHSYVMDRDVEKLGVKLNEIYSDLLKEDE